MDKEILKWLISTVNNRIEDLENNHDPLEIKEEIKMANYVLYKLGKLEDMGDI